MLQRLFSQAAVSRLLGQIAAHRAVVIGVACLVTLLAAHLARQLRLESNLIELLPDSAPSVRALHRALDEVGGTGDLMVMIESPDGEAQLRYARELLPEVRRLEWVERAALGDEVGFFERDQLLYADLHDLRAVRDRIAARLEYERLARNPLYVDLEDRGPPPVDVSDIEDKYRGSGAPRPLYRSDDGTILILVVRPRGVTGDLEQARSQYHELADLVERHAGAAAAEGVRVSIGGTVWNRVAEYDSIVRDVRSSAVLVAVALLLLLVWYFRSLTAFAVLVVPLAMSMAWTFAIAYLLIGSLNIITVFLLVVLAGLGIDFGIHMLARFQRERLAGRRRFDALVETVTTAGRASFTAALTTAVCFFTLTIAEFRGLSELGVIAGIGMLAAAVAFLVVMPALLSFMPVDRRLVPRRQRPRAPRRRRRRRWRAITFAGIGVGLLGAALATGVEFEYDLREIRAPSPVTRDFNRKMRRVFSDPRDPAVIVVDRRGDASAVGREIERRSAGLGERSPIDKVVSVDSLIPADVDAKLAVLADLRQLLAEVPRPDDPGEAAELDRLRRLSRVTPVRSAADLPEEVRRRFLGTGEPPPALVFVFQRESLMDLREAVAFADALSDIEVDGRRYRPASEALVLAEMFRGVRRDAPLAVALSLAALVALLLIDLGSLAATALILVPLLWGLAVTGGLMAIIGARLNLLNAVVLASVVGLGVDAGVHIFHAVRAAHPKKLTQVLRHTGGAVTVCTATSMIGFGSMLAANHPGLQSIGLLAVISLGACLIGALVVLPGLLVNVRGLDHWSQKR